MSVLVSISHIAGAIAVLVAFGLGLIMLAAWEQERNQKSAFQEASFALGIPIDDLGKDENLDRLIQYSAAKYSAELFRNRFSDLCGWIQLGWVWLSNIFQTAVLLGVIWYTVTDDLSNAVNAWWVVVAAFFFWISSALFALTCKLLTGRFPGQARQVRKALAQVI